jgi:DNA excision repair protein ERCC-2
MLDLCNTLQNILIDVVQHYVIEEDGLIPNDELEQQLMHRFKITSLKLEQLITDVLKIGETIRDKKISEGKLPRSYIHSIASFLLFWHNIEAHNYVKVAVGGGNPRIECYCLDPAFATDIVRKCHASIHMSGTMRPLDEYRDTIGLPLDTMLKVFPSPFPAENLTVCYVDDVTTRYEEWTKYPELVSRLGEHIVAITNKFDRNAVVFFPSFNILTEFIEAGLKARIKRSVYVEEQHLSQPELMETVMKFKESSEMGNVLFAVVGGRIGEGIDFPARELEIAVLVGIPYPKPTAKQRALRYYFDMKFKKGWEYTVKAPAIRRLLQSIGRLIRNESDVGCAVILDRRAVHFKEYFEDLKCLKHDELLSVLESFFKKSSKS